MEQPWEERLPHTSGSIKTISPCGACDICRQHRCAISCNIPTISVGVAAFCSCGLRMVQWHYSPSQNARPGGRFAYGQEVSTEEMKKKDLIVKAQRRFEEDNEALLRYVYEWYLYRITNENKSPKVFVPHPETKRMFL